MTSSICLRLRHCGVHPNHKADLMPGRQPDQVGSPWRVVARTSREEVRRTLLRPCPPCERLVTLSKRSPYTSPDGTPQAFGWFAEAQPRLSLVWRLPHGEFVKLTRAMKDRQTPQGNRRETPVITGNSRSMNTVPPACRVR